ncbi:MAG TPA: isoleucine--tRNA ligase [Candidatus Kapabacteria bacterium]|nr:isoleucine--tRNA ligase [Candidatus Kapabacteria bacterium]
MPYNANQYEKDMLAFWKKQKTFEKSVTERPEGKPYVFYDGPPFATGLPHYGHIVASLMKDVVPRYYTMKGYRVERRWGWDCHGLPIENIIEKELNLGSKQEIEAYGIDRFNEACRATVLRYAEEWKVTIERMGRWVDMEQDYKTMDLSFMESVWWVFAELWNKGLIYEGYKSMHICPRCVTTLSNFEVTLGYKEVKDISATVQCKVLPSEKATALFGDTPAYILAWTTTPWTLPGNVLLAVGSDIGYDICRVEGKDGLFVVAKERADDVFGDTPYEIVSVIRGRDLEGLTYEPLFPYFADTNNAFRVVTGEFVTTEDGTGIVHIAPAFGDDDFALGEREGVPLVQHVTMEGTFIPAVSDFSGMDVKPKDDPTKTDVEMIKWLAHNGKLFSKQKYEHSYPHCWRCDTPLLNYATSSWFVSVTKLKEDLLANNAKTNWVPSHMKDGRFGKWLEGAHDWAISRSRYWGTPLPVWKCDNHDCKQVVVFGSVKALEKESKKTITDLHKHKVDDITIPCKKCKGDMHRIPEVLDCWFESGSMPYGQMHYPFENKEKFEHGFPAEFIAEGQDQTRGWFYTLHVLATALTRGDKPSIPVSNSEPAFRNVIVNGIVLAEDGRKMSKRLKNYPDPLQVLETYGADAMRYYLVSSPVMHAESLNFSEAGVREMYNKVVNTLWNVFEFYRMFAEKKTNTDTSDHVLDIWILTKLHMLTKEVTTRMDAYELAEASRPLVDFITELSQWYVRRSRDRVKGDNEEDKAHALATLRTVLLTLSKLLAPFTPFIAEYIYQDLGGEKESVHLDLWPDTDDVYVRKNEGVLRKMENVRKVVEMGLSLRAEAGLKVRQPLATLAVVSRPSQDPNSFLTDAFKEIMKEELNVKDVVEVPKADASWKMKEDSGFKVALDTTVTDALKKEGLVREVVRAINQIRKEQHLTREHLVVVSYATDSTDLRDAIQAYDTDIRKLVLAKVLEPGEGETSVDLGGHTISFRVRPS